MNLQLICYFVLFFLNIQKNLGIFLNSKYLVDVENVFLCPENSQLEIPMRKLQIDRINRTHRAFTAEFSLAEPIDNTVEATLEMEHFSDGKWVRLPFFPYQKDPCRKLMDGNVELIKNLYVTFGKALGLENPENCDIPARNYTMSRFPVKILCEVPFWGGRYKTKLILRRITTKKLVWCSGAFLNFIEMN